MKKREFLKSASVLAAGAAFPQLMACNNMKKGASDGINDGLTESAIKVGRTNWAGNYTYCNRQFGGSA